MIARLVHYFRRQVEAIEGDRALRLYGACIAATLVVTFAHWQLVIPAAEIASKAVPPVCWPFWDDCASARVFSPSTLDVVLWIFGGASALTALLFLRGQGKWAYGLLLTLTLLMVAIVVQDYRLRANQHYMAVWVTGVYLFAPRKRELLKLLLVAFYFWAGLLKLDADWLSGDALHGKLPFFESDSALRAACAYVVALELALVWGVLSERKAVFWLTLAQLVAFHLMSWPVVGFFYPLLMFGLLAIFPLCRREPNPWPRPKALAKPALALLVPFSLLQLAPHAYRGDPALTGQGRMFALHMFDAKVLCKAGVVLHDKNGKSTPLLMGSRLPRRVACDPLVYFHFAKTICRRKAADPSFDDLDLMLHSRRATQAGATEVIFVERFCAANLSYDTLKSNAWIHGGG